MTKKLFYKLGEIFKKYAKYCQHNNCDKLASFNYCNNTKKLYCKQYKKEGMVCHNFNPKKVSTYNRCKYVNCKKYTNNENNYCNIHKNKCEQCDIRTRSSNLCKKHINPVCKFENCNRIANDRKLKIGNCHLKNTTYEYCSYHKPKKSINKKFPYKTIFDKKEIPLKFYNFHNDNIFKEYKNYIYKLLQNHKFKFLIKLAIYKEAIVYDHLNINPFAEEYVNHIESYQKHFKKRKVTNEEILNVIRKFKKYYGIKNSNVTIISQEIL